MANKIAILNQRKKIALIAHDHKKPDLLEWVRFNRGTLLKHDLFATGTTGKVLEQELGTKVTIFESGPLGGDQQIGSRIAEGCIDFLIFFWDPLEPMSHDPDVKALLRMAVVWNIPIACNRSSADFMISSSLMCQEYPRILPDYESYRHRLKNQ
jgi:methylglyoxal synthase